MFAETIAWGLDYEDTHDVRALHYAPACRERSEPVYTSRP